MENAIWKEKNIAAAQVAMSYELEKQIRKASANKELRCADPECSSPMLKFCNGSKKRPYFAHCSNCNCDYAIFDRNNGEEIRSVRKSLFEHFQKLGYSVNEEKKILPHRYSHLLLSFDNDKEIAIEFATQATAYAHMIHVTEDYAKSKILCKWVLIGDYSYDNSNPSFKEKFSINESKTLLIVGSNGKDVTQYIPDPNEYCVNGKKISSDNYPDFYCKKSTIDNLIFENGELTISGFYEEYWEWLQKKEKAFKKYKEKNSLERDYKKIEEVNKQFNSYEYHNDYSRKNINFQPVNESDVAMPINRVKTNLEVYRDQLINSNNRVEHGNFQLRLCAHCNSVKKAVECDPHSFYDWSSNLGCCKECKRKNQPRTFFKNHE